MTDDVAEQIRNAVECAAARVTPPDIGVVRRRARQRVARVATTAVVVVGALAGGGVLAAVQVGSGSNGQVVSVLQRPPLSYVPVIPGASSPSPYTPPDPSRSRDPGICSSHLPVDSRNHLTGTITLYPESDREIVAPAGTASTTLTSEQIVQRFKHSDFGNFGGHPFAVFGLFSPETPATSLPNGQLKPLLHNTPAWVVAVCDGGPTLDTGGPAPIGPPTTAPSPGPPWYGVLITAYSAGGRPIWVVAETERPTPARLAQRFVSVPWQRTYHDGYGGRQIQISYPAAEPCATFDHVDVMPWGYAVYLQVWLRLLPGGPSQCTPTARHYAWVALTDPLGSRKLVDGLAPIP